MQAGGEHRGVVAKENVARFKKSRKVGEDVMKNGARGAIHDHETRGVAARGGRLRDEAGRHGVVEEIGGKWHDGERRGK